MRKHWPQEATIKTADSSHSDLAVIRVTNITQVHRSECNLYTVAMFDIPQ